MTQNSYKFKGQIHKVDGAIHEGDLEVEVYWGQIMTTLARKAIRNKSGVTRLGPLTIRWNPKGLRS